MKKIFIEHTEEALLGVGLFLLGIVVLYFAWGVKTIVSDFNAVTEHPKSDVQATHFRVDDADALGISTKSE